MLRSANLTANNTTKTPEMTHPAAVVFPGDRNSHGLDLLSTSQTNSENALSSALLKETEEMLWLSRAKQERRCENNAPFIFFVDSHKRAHVVQGCCNSWLCPRCGQMRAREEYGRIVHGSTVLQETGNPLFFWTLTCRGRDMSLAQAQTDYLTWTNRLLTSARTKQKRAGTGAWAYAQVTERQTRQHPHSHLITTYAPPDAKETTITKPDGSTRKTLVSEWFTSANAKAGLGSQHEITEVRNPVAVAVYVAKYLFKDAVHTEWPRNWRRVRYSNSWPKLPELTNDTAFPLITASDWNRAANMANVLYADSMVTYEKCLTMRIFHVKVSNNERVETWVN